MKKWAVLISAVGLAFSVSGCSSDYVMATKDGRMILTDGKPTVDDDTGLISYEDQCTISEMILQVIPELEVDRELRHKLM